ncbi:MAG: hypothetical protein K2X38_20730 [Gemmataceae bacterium]|nr:hypothetical protein [Gemmataceae bacterium]
MEHHRKSLLAADPDPLERLAVDQLCLAWLQSSYISAYSAERAATAKKLEFLQHQQQRALQRIQITLETIVKLRRGTQALAHKTSSTPQGRARKAGRKKA